MDHLLVFNSYITLPHAFPKYWINPWFKVLNCFCFISFKTQEGYDASMESREPEDAQTRGTLPTHVNWVAEGRVTPVKDQVKGYFKIHSRIRLSGHFSIGGAAVAEKRGANSIKLFPIVSNPRHTEPLISHILWV